MIWDYIRDFIVQYITGGITSGGLAYGGTIGNVALLDSDGSVVDFTDLGSNGFMVPIGKCTSDDLFSDVAYSYISLGDWLATTITAVIMVLMVVLACLLVRWVFKLVVNGFLARR